MEVLGGGEGCLQNLRAFQFVLSAPFSGCGFSGLRLRCRLIMGIRQEDG